MKIFNEDEWFDTFYPFDNWRKEFHVINDSGCCWMDYMIHGYPTIENDNGVMEIQKFKGNPKFIDHFFIECGILDNENDVHYFIQPYFQPKDNTYYANVSSKRIESNLDLYKIYITGNDDSSYTKHFIGMEDLMLEVKKIKEEGIGYILNDPTYFFTN